MNRGKGGGMYSTSNTQNRKFRKKKKYIAEG